MVRCLGRAVIFLSLLAVVDREAVRATTVYPEVTKCPVCDKSFVVMKIGSYNTFGEQARDLSSSPFARFTKAQTCPHCLYSALNSDFDEISTTEKDALKKLLAHLRLKLCAEEAKALAAAEEDSPLRDQDYLGLLIARQCNAVRTHDAQRGFDMSLQFFYRSAYLKCDELHALYRRRAIGSLRGELGTSRFSRHEQATFTYLLGELLRQDGQNDAALGQFARATELAKSLPSSAPADDEESGQWIIDWAREQSCRARLAKEPAEKLRPLVMGAADLKDEQARFQRDVALATLAARSDRESWRVLADFVEAAPANFFYLAERTEPSEEQLRLDPRLWERVQRERAAAAGAIGRNEVVDPAGIPSPRREAIRWLGGDEYGFSGNCRDAAVLEKLLPELNRSMFVEVKTRPTETVQHVARRLAYADDRVSEPKRVIELNPRLKQPTDKVGSPSVRAVRTPPMWSEKRLMANLHCVIRKGDPRAIEYFFRWCGTVGPVGLDRFKYYISDCLDTLAADASRWSVPGDLQASDVAEQRFLACCLRYLQGDRKATEELLAHLKGESDAEASLAAGCFSSRRDPAVKDAILKHWEAGKRYAWYAGHKVNEYLGRVATPEDFPRIEAIASQENVDRHTVEAEILTPARLEVLLRRSLEEGKE